MAGRCLFRLTEKRSVFGREVGQESMASAVFSQMFQAIIGAPLAAAWLSSSAVLVGQPDHALGVADRRQRGFDVQLGSFYEMVVNGSVSLLDGSVGLRDWPLIVNGAPRLPECESVQERQTVGLWRLTGGPEPVW